MTSPQRKMDQDCCRMAQAIERLQNEYAATGELCDQRSDRKRFSGAADRPISRTTDKATSHDGAAHIRPAMTELHREYWRRLAATPDSTANEIANGNESLRKRAKELVDAGHAKEVGRRKCKRTGRMATIYRAVR